MVRACDIDKLRDLVVRQAYAKTRDYVPPGGYYSQQAVDPIIIERQLNTYLAQGVTVATLTKCVEAIEKEANERYQEERRRDEQRRAKQRIIRICEVAKAYTIDDKDTIDALYDNGYSRKADLNKLRRDAELTIKETGDPWTVPEAR